MKLHTDAGDQFILSSDDIITSGKNIGKLLTDVIDDHTTDINDLKKYTKWLYKYGGTGSKGGSSGSGSGSSSNVKLQYQVKLAGITVQNSNESIILGDKVENDRSIPLEIILSNVNVNNIYYLKNLNVNGNLISISGRDKFTLDNDFRQSYILNLFEKNKGVISFLLGYTSNDGTVQQESISINYIKNAYTFKTDIINNNGASLFSNNESIFYTNSINSGVNLKIDYDLQTEDDIIVNTTSDLLSEHEFTLNAIDKKEGYCVVSFNDDFISNTENLIGDYMLPLSFYSNGVRIYQEVINFTIVPADDVFIKVKPVLPNAQIYKYNDSNSDFIVNTFNTYSKYYDLYVKLNKNKTLDSNEVDDILSYFEIEIDDSNRDINFYEELINILYDKLNNYTYYVFAAGNIGFSLSPYMPSNFTNESLYYILGKYNYLTNEIEYSDQISLGTIKASQKNKSFNINITESGIYTISFFTDHTSNKIKYYFYAYNKDNTFNWYRSNIDNIFNEHKEYLHYFRNGNVTSAFSNYKSKQYIQQFASNNDITICNINANNIIRNDVSYDCFCSIGIQYSYINKSNSYKDAVKTPIITINSHDDSNKLKVDIYQNKIIIGGASGKEITLFLPKEQNYNVLNNGNYHLLSIYKRYLYYNEAPYYEICVYLDGVLEGAMSSFTNLPVVWNSIILHNSNYSINLAEISYLPHSNDYFEDQSGNIVYLDDIAISEYHYKYANECNSSSTAINDIGDILNSLRKFKETSYGMIEVENRDIIKEISKSINIPIIIFDYFEDGIVPNFVSNFFPSAGQEGKKFKWYLTNLYYSPGKYELDLSKSDCRINLPGNDGKWYIELQGSSTMQYFVKNLTLGIECDAGHIYLFTPNFMYAKDNDANVEEAKKTYLPERAFTLKADMVDSSHCNNTSIGEFVNNNTQKFKIQFSNSDYSKYVKNCLTGFPILTFIRINSYDENGNTKENIYFLGIYNFNLGRNSYFNMGYNDPGLLQTNNNGHIHNILKTCNGHQFVTVTYQLPNDDDIELKTNESVIVAEIQGNSNYNDFSQYSTSILAPINDKDDGAMFGDFVPKLTPNTQNKTLWHLQRLVEHVAKGGGYIFDYVLKKHLGVHSWSYNKYIEDGYNSSIFNSANQVPTYRLQFKRNPISGSNDDEEKKSMYMIDINDNNYENIINQLITNNSTEYSQNLKSKLINLIFNIVNPNETLLGYKEAILDYPSLSEYYTICMAFGLTDSVMKNLNVKTWNASWSDTYINNPNQYNITGKWYVAFYDMDSAFGRYNNGSYLENSYFSFSDYWLSDETKLSKINIYRDFHPKVREGDPYVGNQKLKIHGYDSPSSYLFAVAKYAALAMGNSGSKYISKNDGTSLDEYSENDYFRMFVPQNLWTKFRMLPSSSNGTPYFNLHGVGELRNAKYFVNNYFSGDMNNIPEQLWNMNYRFKYLKRIEHNVNGDEHHEYIQSNAQNGGFITKEIESFHGRGIYQVEDWLDHRFHILDAYFNVDESITPITYLVYNNSHEIVDVKNDNGDIIGHTWNDTSVSQENNSGMPKWEETGYYDIIPVSASDLLKNNEDVALLKDIFSKQDEARYQNVNLNVKALEYSPLVIIPYAKIYKKKYLLINSDQWYNISIEQQTTDAITFGGSGLWTDIENMNSLITGKSLSIYSDKIKNLVITGGICQKWDISEMKSLTLIDIKKYANDTTSELSGDITIEESETNILHPDLQTIKLERTNINLNIDGGNVSGIKDIEYTYSSGNLSIINCLNLVNLKLNGSKINECKILPGWSNNIKINNVNIANLTISASDKNANNNELYVSGISTLEKIYIQGNFKKVSISDCPKLTEIYVDKPLSIETLIINKCNISEEEDTAILPLMIYVLENTTYIECTSIEDGEIKINLNNFNNLKEISFDSTFGFNIIDISELEGFTLHEYEGTYYKSYRFIKLLSCAFRSTKLKEIKTKVYDNVNNENNLYLMIVESDNKTATFSDSYFGADIYGNHTPLNNFFVPKNVKTLANMFSNGAYHIRRGGINTELASMILGNRGNNGYCKFIYENKNNITNISGMFYGQNISCNNHADNISLRLSSFTNVSNISAIYEFATSCSYISKVLFEYDDPILGTQTLGSEVNTINISNFMTFSKFELGALSPIINKILKIEYSIGINIGSIYDYTTEEILLNNTIYNADELLFEGITVNNKLEEIIGLNFDKTLAIDWNNLLSIKDNETNTYVKKFPKLVSIFGSFNHENKNDIGFTGNPGIGLEFLNTNISLISSFSFENIDDPINYDIVHNLNVIKNAIICNKDTLNMYKKTSNDKLISYIRKYNDIGITNLDYAFKKIVLDESETDYHTLSLDTGLTTYNFTSMNFTFSYMKCLNDIPLVIDINTLRSFTKVTKWQETFSNITLYKNLPINMFNQRINGKTTYNFTDYNHVITTMEGMFNNVKITNMSWFDHEYYNINITDYNTQLDGSYHYKISTYELNTNLYNHKCVDIVNENDYNTYGTHIKNHLILPFDILYACTGNCNIRKCFADSNFEGILPDKLIRTTYINEASNPKIENFMQNLLVIPNKISNQNSINGKYNFNILDANCNTLGLYKDEISDFVKISGIDYTNPDPSNPAYKTGKKMNVYIFVPSEFINVKSLSNVFNFKILLPNSPMINDENNDNVQEAYGIFKYDSIGIYENNEFKNAIGLINSFSNTMPGANEKFYDHILPHDDTSVSKQFNPQNYYNLLYFVMMPDVTKIKYKANNNEYNEEELFGLNRKHLGFTYQISNTLKNTLQFGNEPVFNSNISSVLYGYYFNVFEEDNFINFDFSTLQADTDTIFHTPVITLSGESIYKIDVLVGSNGISKFAVLPNIIDNEGYKYVLNLPGGIIYAPTLGSLNTLSINHYYIYINLFKNKLRT